MEWLTGLFAKGTSQLVESIGQVVDELHMSTEEKERLALEKEKLKVEIKKLIQAERIELEKTVRQSLESREKMIVAEMQTGSSYVRNARPSIVYVALGVTIFNYCLVPSVQMLSGHELQEFSLPGEFWAAFATCISVWSVGRSWERISGQNRTSEKITGNPVVSIYDDKKKKVQS